MNQTPSIPTFRRLALLTGAAMTLILLAAHVVFFLRAGAMWRDEVNSIVLATRMSMPELWANLDHDSFPILWFLLLKLWHGLGLAPAAYADLGWRALGLIAGAASLAMMWHTAQAFDPRQRRTPPLLALAIVGFCPAMVQIGDSLRAYGVGFVLMLAALTATWRWLRQPRLSRWLILLATYLLATHMLYFNAMSLLAIGLAAAAVGWRRRSWRQVVAPLAAGAVAAASLMVYLSSFRHAAEWNMLVRRPLSFIELVMRLTHAMPRLGGTGSWSVPGLVSAALVGLLVMAAVVVSARRWRRSGTDPRLPDDHRDAAAERGLFCLVALTVYLPAYAGFLMALSYPALPRYFLAAIAFTGVFTDLALSPTIASPRRRVAARSAFALAFALLATIGLFQSARIAMTNVDVVARMLEEQAEPEDLIIVMSWHVCVSFDYHYHGLAPWTTCPPIPVVSYHRYDLIKQRMMEEDPLKPLLDRVETTLRSGHRVWLATRVLDIPAPGEDPGRMPALREGDSSHEYPYLVTWSRQLMSHLREQSRQAKKVALPATGPVQSYETLMLCWFSR
ncbi:MAG: hypothetical protein IT440_04760 [Phycisphaeraceae bacterium]|nr:hypothetical protein [Phycisphaeraceae bacterium]